MAGRGETQIRITWSLTVLDILSILQFSHAWRYSDRNFTNKVDSAVDHYAYFSLDCQLVTLCLSRNTLMSALV